jgi:hypothetical protein
MPLLLPAVLFVAGLLAIVCIANVAGRSRPRHGSTVNAPTPRPPMEE